MCLWFRKLLHVMTHNHDHFEQTLSRYLPKPIAKSVSEVITQTNLDRQNGMVRDLTLFLARKQVFQKLLLKRKLDFHFPPISLTTRLCCLTLAGFE